MTGKEKKVVFILIGVLVTFLIISLAIRGSRRAKLQNLIQDNEISNTTAEEYVTSFSEVGSNIKLNNSIEFNSNKTYNNIEFSNIKFVFQDECSTLYADVKNIGSDTHEDEVVALSIIAQDGSTSAVLKAIIPKIEPGETKHISTSATADIINSKNFKIEANT